MGHTCLDAIPSTITQIGMAQVTYPKLGDIKVLEDFIIVKERHIAQPQDVERNINAILQTKWLISYLKGFPSRD